MAASSQDKLMEVGIATATTLDANYTINDTSITVASTSGWPTATGVAFAIDVVDSNGVQIAGTYNEYVGVVSSATSITSVDHMNGTDRNYSAGATTRVYIPVSAERENRIVDWGVVQHKQDGTHADTITTDTINENTPANGVTIDGLNIKDGKLNTALSVPNSAIQNGAVTPEKILAGTGTGWAWQSWTPTYSGLTVGSGTVTASYIQIGKTVHFHYTFLFGSGSSVGAATITLPVAPSSNYTAAAINGDNIGEAIYVDDSTAVYQGSARLTSGSTCTMIVRGAAGTYVNQPTGLTSTIPMTWATGDRISWSGTYEAA